jgi:polyphosphate kinase
VVEGILGVALMDNVKARCLQPDGTYRRCPAAKPGEPSIRSQVEFQNMARELSIADPMRPASASAAVGLRLG